ncbi:MAG: hypothetical protein C4334_06880 [Pyrinomonas sp.]
MFGEQGMRALVPSDEAESGDTCARRAPLAGVSALLASKREGLLRFCEESEGSFVSICLYEHAVRCCAREGSERFFVSILAR